MNPRAIRTGAEVALVLGSTGLLLELVQTHSWAIILLGVTALVWMQARQHQR